MTLDERLNQALNTRGLRPQPVRATVKEIRPSPKAKDDSRLYETIDEALKDIAKITPDDDGIRSVTVQTLDLADLRLPKAVDGIIIDDIQKLPQGGYEVHLLLQR